MDNEIRINTTVPPEIVEDPVYHRFLEEIKSFKGKPQGEHTKAEIKAITGAFHEYLQDYYPEYDNLECKLMGSYHREVWDKQDIIIAYHHMYPDRYKEKEEYTRLEINNMLFDLQVSGRIWEYENVVYPFSSDETKNEIWDDKVTVLSID